MSNFSIIAVQNQGRRADYRTASGRSIRTPCFAPVATAAALKGVLTDDLPPDGFDLLLSNTYHMLVRPGADVISDLGGLHQMLHWDRAILTDSGGFQVFSLAGARKIDAEGVTFQNHVDGSPLRLTPENVVEAQLRFGSDIAMVLDVCPALPSPEAVVKAAVEQSLTWAEKSIRVERTRPMDLFGIVQGGTDPELRAYSAQQTTALNFDGYAIGGLSVGESANALYSTLEATTTHLPTEQIRYLMGVGRPDNIVEAVARGVDLFDCVLPTRNARNGKLLTWSGFLNIGRSEHQRSTKPIDGSCVCPTCQTASRGVLRHLYKSRELNYYRLATVHNLWFMAELMEAIRTSIENHSFQEVRQRIVSSYSDID